jgi:hypothetical protein
MDQPESYAKLVARPGVLGLFRARALQSRLA